MSYTLGMKTAVSLPDELFARADEMARRLGKSRSQLYRDALVEYLSRHDPRAITESLDRLMEELGEPLDSFSAEAAQQALERSEW